MSTFCNVSVVVVDKAITNHTLVKLLCGKRQFETLIYIVSGSVIIAVAVVVKKVSHHSSMLNALFEEGTETKINNRK